MSKQPKAFTDIFKDEPPPEPAFKPQERDDGLRQVNLRLNESAKIQIDIMAAENNTTRQALIVEAINDFFKKNGRPPIA